MSRAPISPRPDVQQLEGDGYEVEIRHEYLLVHSVPYVTPAREVATGVLICKYSEQGKPEDHVVLFQGETPCSADGTPIPHLIADSNHQVLFDKFEVQHRFSNKPSDVPGFPADYYAKLVHYVHVLGARARAIDVNADARTGKVILSREADPIFAYPDSASARAEIVAISQKLELARVALIGVGGTGSYILDQLAKTRVREIHLFDGDEFKRHNAFRAPGAASVNQLKERLAKVDYFAKMYSAMHLGVKPHSYHITKENLSELDGFDFVFVSVDRGPTRGLLADYLAAAGVPFIDVGLGLEKGASMSSLRGQARVTLATKSKQDHLSRRLDTKDDAEEAIYGSNIQVADMNALNAVLAVMKWKQHLGFYEDYDRAHHLAYSVAMQSIARAEVVGK